MKTKLFILIICIQVLSFNACGQSRITEDLNNTEEENKIREKDVHISLTELLPSSYGEIKEGEYTHEFAPFYYFFDQSGVYETVKVYTQVYDSLYAMFNIVHEVSTSHFKNLWRIKDSHMYKHSNGSMIWLYQILTPGENEFVWAAGREGVEDATGGFHGNERIDLDPEYGSIHFFADGRSINPSDATRLTSAESFHYIQRSTMHQTGTGGLVGSSSYIAIPDNPIECYHEKKTVFEKGGYTTYNKLEWADNETPVRSNNFGLFCVTIDISKEGYNEDGKHAVFNNNGAMKLESEGSKIVMFNKDLDIKVICDSRLTKPTGYPTTSRIWDTNIYHKYYNRLAGGGIIIETKKGDIWESEASIRFERMN